MAQTIKHRRGKLESIASITPINGELIIASGSDLSVHQEGLLFVGVEGNVLTPSNKILTGSAAIDVTGGSFDHSVDGIPYYDTDDKKLFILGHGGNTNVTFTTNSLDFNGSGIVSSSTQVSELAGINDSTVTITAGDGLKTGGTFTTNQSGNSAVTLDIDVSDFAGTGLEADGSENLRLASQGNGIAGGGGSTLSVDLDGSTLSLSSDGLKAGDAILNTSLNTFTGSNANDRLNAFTGSTNLTIAGNSVSINGGSVTAANILKGTGVVSGSAQIDGSALGSNKTITIGGSSVTLGGTLSNSELLEEVVGGTGIQSGSGDIAGVTAGDGLTGGGTTGTVSLAVNVDDSTIEINSDTVRLKDGGTTLAKQADMAADRIQGRANGGGTGAPQALTAAQVRTIINVEDGATADQTGAEIATALNADLGGNFTIGNQSSDTATFTGGVTIAGDLTVNGTTTYISSSNLNIGDNILELNYAGTAADAGILVKDAVSTGTSGSLLWDASEDYWIAGALGSEARVVVGTGTTGDIVKFSAAGVIADSILSESGTTLTVSNNVIVSGLTASQLVATNGSKQLVSTTDISSLTLTLDGGEF